MNSTTNNRISKTDPHYEFSYSEEKYFVDNDGFVYETSIVKKHYENYFKNDYDNFDEFMNMVYPHHIYLIGYSKFAKYID